MHVFAKMKLKIAAIKHNICTKAVPLRPNSYCALQRAIFLNSGTIVKIFRGRRNHPAPVGREIQTIQTINIKHSLDSAYSNENHHLNQKDDKLV